MTGWRWTRRVVAVLASVVLVVGLAGCGGDDDDDAAAGDDTTTTAADETTTTTAAPIKAAAMDLVATDYAYAEAGGGTITAPAGPIEISLRNDGAEEHQATVISFKEGKTLADLAAVGTDPKQLYDVIDGWGGPNVVAPGSTVAATVDLEEGDYALICFIPSADGVPHAAKGMISPFSVAAPAGDEVTLPAGDESDTVVVKDFGFGFPEGFDGSGDLIVENTGPQVHELAIYRLDEGVTVADAVAYDAASGEPPPYTSVTGVAPMNVGQRNRLSVDLDPGEYMVICFLPDKTDGAPHFTKGMAQPLSVE